VVAQKLNISYFQLKRYFSNFVKSPFGKNDDEWLSFTREMAELEKTINNEIIEEMVRLYLGYLRLGYRVIIVSHSQGNMYANAAYAKVISQEEGYPFKDSISIVSVGSPISEVARGDIPSLKKPHATALGDMYMWGVRIATLGSNNLPTFSYKNKTEDYLGHSFVNAYLYDETSKGHIANGLKWSFENTKFPHTAKSTEVIRFELIKPNQKVSMFVHEEFSVGEYIPVDYFVGYTKQFTEQNLKSEYPNVTYGFGDYVSTGVKDTYVLRCADFQRLNEKYGIDDATVKATVYIVNESGEYQPARLELYDIKNTRGSYLELEAEPLRVYNDYIDYNTEMGGVNYVNFGNSDYFIHNLNRPISGYQKGDVYKLENIINTK